MPSYTNFLNLTLPALSEFLDSWNEPMNQNFEQLDDWTEDLHASLVGVGTGSTWAALRGSLANLAARLDVSIDQNGNIDVSSSGDIVDMSTSAYHGKYGNPRDRLNAGDSEVYAANQPFANGRFTPTAPDGPDGLTEGAPNADLDAGIAIRSADFGARSGSPISSPTKPWSPGLIMGGDGAFISGTGQAGQVRLNGQSTPAIFNIDGYVFSLREDLVFDYSNIPLLSVNDYVWIYVDRDSDNYDDPQFLYSEVGGAPVARDLRVLKEGNDGVTSNSTEPLVATFSSASGGFDSFPGKVKEGHILRIIGGLDEGDYVIEALDGTTPDEKFTIRGVFKDGSLGPGVNYQIIDNSVPSIGAAIAAANPDFPESLPPFVPGRVYIGRVLHLGGAPSPLVTFARGGVWDSGWLPASDLGTPVDYIHELGVIPSRVEVWVREAAEPANAYRPIIFRDVVTDLLATPTAGPGDIEKTAMPFPALTFRSDELRVKVELFDPTSGLFTKDPSTAPSDIAIGDGEIRVIAWR